jgi:hypothetical protein
LVNLKKRNHYYLLLFESFYANLFTVIMKILVMKKIRSGWCMDNWIGISKFKSISAIF